MKRGNAIRAAARALLMLSFLPVFVLSIMPTAQSGNHAGYVMLTLDLCNNTLYPGNANVTEKIKPFTITYNPNNGYLYVLVTSPYSGSSTFMLVVDPINNTIIDSILLTSGFANLPLGAVYDPENGYVYVATNDTGVLVVNPATKEVVARIPIHDQLEDVVYDPENGYIYATALCSGTVVVINPATNSIVATIGVGPDPDRMIYDPRNGYIYVTRPDYGEVSVIDPKNDSVVANITVGAYPHGITYDPRNGYIYVAEQGGVAVIDPSTDRLATYIPIGNYVADAIAYDPRNGYIYVTACYFSSPGCFVIAIAPNNTVVGEFQVGYGPRSIVYDPVSGYLYVANVYSGTLSIIATPNVTSTGTSSGIAVGTTSSTAPANNSVAAGGQTPAANPSTSASCLPEVFVLVGVIAVALVSVALIITRRK